VSDHILTDATHAVMTRKYFDALPEYSLSIPTGVTIGKRWKRVEPFVDDGTPKTWFMGEYAEEPDQVTYPGMVQILRRLILIVDESPHGV
jgi:hypothetical protein